MPSVANYFDLGFNNSYYILTAYGPIIRSGSIGYHTFYESSSKMFSFQNNLTNQSFNNLTTNQTPIISIGKYSEDTIRLSWIDTGKLANISMTNQMSNNNWFSFGLSKDKLMVIILKTYFNSNLKYYLLKGR
jgi:hypothetical protein